MNELNPYFPADNQNPDDLPDDGWSEEAVDELEAEIDEEE